MVSVLFHLVAAAYHSYALVYPYYYDLLQADIHKGFGGRLKFLTIWGHLIQVGYFMFAALVDLYNLTRPSPCPTLKRVRDWWFSTLVFPISLLVFILFWGIYSVKKDLIIPKHLEHLIDPTFNHMIHTYIILWSMAEPLVTTIAIPKKRLGLIFIACFAAAYTIWSYILYIKLGRWVYPILNALTDFQRVLFIFASYLLVFCIFLLTREYQKKFGKREIGAVKTE